jgi:hypothetical protein
MLYITPLGIFSPILVCFCSFWFVVPRKAWQPWTPYPKSVNDEAVNGLRWGKNKGRYKELSNAAVPCSRLINCSSLSNPRLAESV